MPKIVQPEIESEPLNEALMPSANDHRLFWVCAVGKKTVSRDVGQSPLNHFESSVRQQHVAAGKSRLSSRNEDVALLRVDILAADRKHLIRAHASFNHQNRNIFQKRRGVLQITAFLFMGHDPHVSTAFLKQLHTGK